jgi:Mg2+ and Co2+ transporter CorA
MYLQTTQDPYLPVFQLFQLRSIEQNELAIVADSQNKAILVFTAVTIIFLPLSFFTGYFGMNLRGVGENKDESWFWEVCGTIAFLIIVGSMVYAFRYNLRSAIFRPLVSVV